MESAFNDIGNSGLQDCSIREKGTLCKDFFESFEILEHSFLSEHSQNVFLVQSGSTM